MKLIDIMEARRNPHLNPRYTLLQELQQLANKFGTDNVVVRFVTVLKLGINPKFSFESTPMGLYFYPIQYVLDNFNSIPYAANFPYALVCKIVPNAKIWNLPNTNVNTMKQQLKGAIHKMFPNAKFDKLDNSTNIKELWNSIAPTILSHHMHDAKPFQFAFVDSKSLPFNVVRDFRKLLVSMGIDGIWEGDNDIIYRNEPNQVVIFQTNKVKQLGVAGNKKPSKTGNNWTVKTFEYDQTAYLKHYLHNTPIRSRDQLFDFFAQLTEFTTELITAIASNTNKQTDDVHEEYIQGVVVKKLNPTNIVDSDFPTFNDPDEFLDWLRDVFPNEKQQDVMLSMVIPEQIQMIYPMLSDEDIDTLGLDNINDACFL